MELGLIKLSKTFKDQEEPACDSCGYTADWLLRFETLERLFCERDLRDAMLDLLNWQKPGSVPDVLSF